MHAVGIVVIHDDTFDALDEPSPPKVGCFVFTAGRLTHTKPLAQSSPDHFALAKLEGERLPPIARGIKLLAIRESSRIVDVHRLACTSKAPVMGISMLRIMGLIQVRQARRTKTSHKSRSNK